MQCGLATIRNTIRLGDFVLKAGWGKSREKSLALTGKSNLHQQCTGPDAESTELHPYPSLAQYLQKLLVVALLVLVLEMLSKYFAYLVVVSMQFTVNINTFLFLVSGTLVYFPG